MKKHIYADNAATTKLDIDAFEAMKAYMLGEYGNASQPYSFSRAPKKALKEARSVIAEVINASPDEIYFTSGGTESNNWVINGIAFSDYVKTAFITSQIEHHSILNACAMVEKLGYPVAYLPATEKGLITIDALNSIITQNTKLVSVMYANNEIGTIQPIKELCAIAHKRGALFHTDAVQAVGHIKIDVKELGVDLLSASAHKFNGPKGVGFLYIKKGTPISSYMAGGAQEQGLRAGTENVPAIVAMAVALKNNNRNLSKNIQYLYELERVFCESLKTLGVDFLRNGTSQLPGNISLSFKNADGETILHRLDLMGISVSTGAACDNVKTQLSHVLQAISLPDEYAKGTIRISFGTNNTVEDIEEIARALAKILI